MTQYLYSMDINKDFYVFVYPTSVVNQVQFNPKINCVHCSHSHKHQIVAQIKFDNLIVKTQINFLLHNYFKWIGNLNSIITTFAQLLMSVKMVIMMLQATLPSRRRQVT